MVSSNLLSDDLNKVPNRWQNRPTPFRSTLLKSNRPHLLSLLNHILVERKTRIRCCSGILVGGALWVERTKLREWTLGPRDPQTRDKGPSGAQAT